MATCGTNPNRKQTSFVPAAAMPMQCAILSPTRFRVHTGTEEGRGNGCSGSYSTYFVSLLKWTHAHGLRLKLHPFCSTLKASVVMERLSYPTETVLSNKITSNRTVLSFKDSPRKPLIRRPRVGFEVREPGLVTCQKNCVHRRSLS